MEMKGNERIPFIFHLQSSVPLTPSQVCSAAHDLQNTQIKIKKTTMHHHQGFDDLLTQDVVLWQ